MKSRYLMAFVFLALSGCATATIVGYNKTKRTVSLRVNSFGTEATAHDKAMQYCGSDVQLQGMKQQSIGSTGSVYGGSIFTNNEERAVYTYTCRK